MRAAAELGIRAVAPEGDNVARRSEVLLNGAPTGKFVPGAVFEAAVATPEWFLLFTTHDVPYEDALTISLLGPTLEPLENVELSHPYSTGSFTLLELLEPSSVKFRFFGDTDWIVEVLPRPQFQIPFLSDPPGVVRRFGWARRLVIHGRPQPDRDRRRTSSSAARS
jgi:hypothetical protein